MRESGVGLDPLDAGGVTIEEDEGVHASIVHDLLAVLSGVQMLKRAELLSSRCTW